MFFVYLAGMVFLFGAEIASEYPRLRGGAPGADGSNDRPYTSRTVRPKLRDPGDVDAGGDLDKRCARRVGVLATCRCPARHLAAR
jgi:hypothetical protein